MCCAWSPPEAVTGRSPPRSPSASAPSGGTWRTCTARSPRAIAPTPPPTPCATASPESCGLRCSFCCHYGEVRPANPLHDGVDRLVAHGLLGGRAAQVLIPGTPGDHRVEASRKTRVPLTQG